MHLEAGVFDLMTTRIERYRQRAEARYRRLAAVLAELDDEEIQLLALIGCDPVGVASA